MTDELLPASGRKERFPAEDATITLDDITRIARTMESQKLRTRMMNHPESYQLFFEAVIWVAMRNCRWSRLPRAYGRWQRTYQKFLDWNGRKRWEQVVESLGRDTLAGFYIHRLITRPRPMNLINIGRVNMPHGPDPHSVKDRTTADVAGPEGSCTPLSEHPATTVPSADVLKVNRFVILNLSPDQWTWQLVGKNSKVIAAPPRPFPSKNNCMHSLKLLISLAGNCNIWNEADYVWEHLQDYEPRWPV